MVDKPSALTTGLLSWLLSGVVFSRTQVDLLRSAQDSGVLVHVMRSRGLLDYFYFNVAFLREGIRLSRFANGLDARWLRPISGFVASLARGTRGFGDAPTALAAAIHAGASSFVYLHEPGDEDPTDPRRALPLLTATAREARTSGRTVWVVPQLLIWEKRPDREVAPQLRDVFGTKATPRFLMKAVWVARGIWEGFLKLGAPTVQIGQPIDATALAAAHAGESDEQVALRLFDAISQALEAEERVITGPWVKQAAQVGDEILAKPANREALASIAARMGKDRDEVDREARAMLKEIAADFNLLNIKLFSALLSFVWSQIYDGFEVDEEGIARVREVAKNKRIVLVPSHKSHVDYLVLSNLFYRYGLIPPHIAAGINLNFWPIGRFFRGSGAFFIRRSFAGDRLYEWVFRAYLGKLLEEGFPIEFFIEGTRSRTGKLNPPKYGMLNMIVDAFRQGEVDDVAFVPVSVGYEAIIEGSTYRKELEGGEKKSESLTGLLQTPKVLRTRYGRVFVEFGNPVGMAEFLNRYHGDHRGEIAQGDLDRTVRRLAYRLIHEINDVTTVTPGALGSLILLNSPARALSLDAICREAGFAIGYLRERNARFSDSLRSALDRNLATIHRPTTGSVNVTDLDAFDREYVTTKLPAAERAVEAEDDGFGRAIREPLVRALSLLAGKKLVEVRQVDGETLYLVPEDRRTELTYYKNNIVHYFVPEAVFATALFESGESVVELSRARESARYYSQLLKLEFCFAERERFDEVFSASRDEFVRRGWAAPGATPDTLELSQPLPPAAEFMRGLLVSTIETYWLCAHVLLTQVKGETPDAWTEQKAMTKAVLARGKRLYHEGRLIFTESISISTLENALKVFRELGLLETSSESRGRKTARLFRPSRDHASDLERLAERLSSLVERQRRDPNSPLHR